VPKAKEGFFGKLGKDGGSSDPGRGFFDTREVEGGGQGFLADFEKMRAQGRQSDYLEQWG